MTVDIEKLEALAKAATPSKWTTDGEKTVMSAESDQLNAGYAILECHGPDALKNAKFAAAANPAAVLEICNNNEALRGLYQMHKQTETREMRDLKAELAGLKTGYEAYERVNAELRAENEKLRANSSLQKLLTEVSDALEELEIHGQHSDQGYRKLKDWYRKVLLACRVVQSPMFGAEHGDLVSQNTWLRKMVEHYAQQHAPLEQIPDSAGWSTRLPGYDLPALLRDASRYRWLRDKSESVHQFYLSTPIWFTGVKFSKENVDTTIDAAMSEEASHD